jgi:hypothetical protein
MRAGVNVPCPRRLKVKSENEPKHPNRKLARIGHGEGTEENSDSESKKGKPVSY